MMNDLLSRIMRRQSMKQQLEGKLQHVNLKNVRFHSGDKDATKVDDYENLQKLDFVHCEFNDGHKLYEDANFHTFPEEQRAGILKRLEYNYRYLRKHYDEKGDYIEGNDFHYNYMEAKRKNTKNAWDAFLLMLFSVINGYNTKPERVLVWIVRTIYYFSLIVFMFGSIQVGEKIYTTTGFSKTVKLDDLLYSIQFVTKSLIPIPTDLFKPMNYASISVMMIESILGPILIALFIMALRNRFRRSKSDDEFK